MHQQPLQAPRLPNKSSSAGHSSAVSGLMVSLIGLYTFQEILVHRHHDFIPECYGREMYVIAVVPSGILVSRIKY
jgi:hypothetical protein